MIDNDKPVRVFKNLKHGCYSIMQGGRLKASARQVVLTDVEFRVREMGRQRMIREQRPNVHAFAVGTLLDFVHPDDSRELDPLNGRVLTYNPYRFGFFADSETNSPVTFVTIAQMNEDGIVYLDDAA